MIINFISSSKSVFPYRSYSTSPNNQHYRHHYNLSSTSQVSGTDVSVFIKIITISLLPVISADVSVQVPPFVTAACWNCREIRNYYFSNSQFRHWFQYRFCNMISNLEMKVDKKLYTRNLNLSNIQTSTWPMAILMCQNYTIVIFKNHETTN